MQVTTKYGLSTDTNLVKIEVDMLHHGPVYLSEN